MTSNRSVGVDLRALRKNRGLTVTEMSALIGRSIGFISQIERGLSQPSINDLRKIAAIFGVPISFFFSESAAHPSEARHIVRRDDRRTLGTPAGGVVDQLLSPDLGGSFETLLSEFAPHSELVDAVQRGTEEAGYVIHGAFEIEISGVWHELRQGDSFRFVGEPYRWRNRTDAPAILVWVIAPPVY
jgi:transcriptional regulator with XRE-family HTH domain